LAAQPIEVYDALLKAKNHAAFTGAKATCSVRIGGRFTAYDGYIFGKILDLEEGRRILQEWQTTEWPLDAPPSVVEFILKKRADGAELTMVHTNVPAEQAESYRQGWIDYYWNPLKQYFQKRCKE
jgi:activator of HSP90 ATPase